MYYYNVLHVHLCNSWSYKVYLPCFLTCIPVPCSFVPRHNSTTSSELHEMVSLTGFGSIDQLIDATVPKSIRRSDGMEMGSYTAGMTESQFLEQFK